MTSLKGEYPFPCDECDSVNVRILKKSVDQDAKMVEVVCNDCGETWLDYEEALDYE